MRVAFALLLLTAACAEPHPAGDDVGGSDDAGPGDGGLDPDGDPAADAPPNTACPAWCTETPPAGASALHAVWAVNGNDVFAVGDAGTIVRRQNNAWTKMTSGTTANLRGVWGTASNDVWAVGEGGTILRFDGTTWTPVTGVTTGDVAAVWGASANDVWLAATSKMYHWTGAWTNNTVAASMQGLSGTGSTDVWLATENAYLKHYTGTNWGTTVMPTGGGAVVFAVLALSPTNVWSSSGPPNSEMLAWNGSTWTGTSTSGAIFVSLHGTGAANVWGVGGTKIGHFTGTAWDVTAPAGVTTSLRSVHGVGPDVWAVGSGPTIVHHN